MGVGGKIPSMNKKLIEVAGRARSSRFSHPLKTRTVWMIYLFLNGRMDLHTHVTLVVLENTD